MQFDNMFKSKLKALKRDPLRFIAARVNDVTYSIRTFFKPYNVIKCRDLPRSWCDRDHLMFHAMFQILVDYVELEQPFKSWNELPNVKRYTNIEAMKAWNENRYNTQEGRESFYSEWMSEEEKAQTDKSTHQRYLIQKEILYLYEWYKNKKYDLDVWALHEATGEKLQFDKGRITRVPNGKQPLITWAELHQLEDEHNMICDGMLDRILAIRKYLWT
jgi:hypothetical protein